MQVAAGDGNTFGAYIVRPDTPSERTLLHKMFGINDQFRGFCRGYAEQGYTVIAPDLFWRFADSGENGAYAGEIPQGVRLGACESTL